MKRLDTSHLVDGYTTAFIDSGHESDGSYVPNLVSNSNENKVLSTLIDEFRQADSIKISVAFIKESGLTNLLGYLEELEKKYLDSDGEKYQVQIITTDYLIFSEPKALKKLKSFKNVALKMFMTQEAGVGFHTKGYIFHRQDEVRILIGSSNLTQSALGRNYEWNTRIVSLDRGAYAQAVEKEFDEIWRHPNCLLYDEQCQSDYEKRYSDKEQERKSLNAILSTLVSDRYKRHEPNVMQQEFCDNIVDLVNNDQKRALLISATGTGKTYASAFACRRLLEREDYQRGKILFVSHRQQINDQALASYQKIFKPEIPMFSFSGSENLEIAKSAQFLFSTIQTLSKDGILHSFAADEFDIIILDECHRAGADSYKKIIDYFNPKLLLGMSASPDRTDGIDVYSLFDHNIACEIRLQQALENDLLCPFHYFGISELKVFEDHEIDDKDTQDFAYLTSDERIRHIVERTSFYGYSGDKVKGLIFCRSKKEAAEISRKMNLIENPDAGRNYRTLNLSGEDNQAVRKAAIERLVMSECPQCLDYILTVDIFNEGVDIPEINQVVMIRNTESPIVFVQQLGRGLRKTKYKEFVNIIDFIGNYKNNYMIPIALTGDRTGNKDNIRRGMMEGSKVIKGESTIYFDEISRKRIYQSIDSADINQMKILKADYQILKNKLGRIPQLLDFDKYGELDPLRLIAKCGSYHTFLEKCDKDYTVKLSEVETEILEFVSTKFASGKRPHELELLEMILEGTSSKDIIADWKFRMKNVYNIDITDVIEQNVINIMTDSFYNIGSAKEAFANCIFLEEMNGKLVVSRAILALLDHNEFRSQLADVVEFGSMRYLRDYASHDEALSPFCISKKYTYEDVCRLCGWEKNEVSLNIGGYKYDEFSATYPVFINYDKEEEIADTIKYQDRFESPSQLIAISKNGRSKVSKDVQTALRSTEDGIRMELFVRKNKDDKGSKEFYYLGRIYPTGQAEEIVMKDGSTKAVEIQYRLGTPVEKNLFDYITDNIA